MCVPHILFAAQLSAEHWEFVTSREVGVTSVNRESAAVALALAALVAVTGKINKKTCKNGTERRRSSEDASQTGAGGRGGGNSRNIIASLRLNVRSRVGGAGVFPPLMWKP